jgi:hypothetical protein
VLPNRFGDIASDAGRAVAFIEALETGAFRTLSTVCMGTVLLEPERSGKRPERG